MSGGSPSGKVFINYRREDAGAVAGRLFDRLHGHWPGRIFYDIESITPGRDFRQVIEAAIGDGPVMVSVIGPAWLLASPDAPARIHEPDDPVRQEIETALEHELPVFPLLLSGSSMPGASQLPESIRPLAYRNAITLGERFHPEVDRLIEAIEGAFRSFRKESTSAEDGSRPLLSRVFYEPFDSQESIAAGMRSTWLTQSHPGWDTRIIDGHLQWSNPAGRRQTLQSVMRYVIQDTAASLADAAAEVRVRVDPPGDESSVAGLLFRYDEVRDRGYGLFRERGRSVTLFEREGDVMRRGPSFEASGDSDGFVTLRALGEGDQVLCYVNGERVFTVTNPAWREGVPGLLAHSLGCFSFDDFALFRRYDSAGAKSGC